MTEQTSIGDMLNDEPEAPVAEEPAEQAEAQPEAEGQPRGPDGKFLPKAETGVETPTAEPAAEPVPPTEQADRLPPDVYAPLKAIRDENKELKAAIAELRQHMAAPQPQPSAPPVDFWDDPNAFLAQRDNNIVESVVQRIQQQQQIEKLNQSEAAAQAKYPDYEEKFAAFQQAVQLNPRLAQELARAPDPGEFAYSRGKTALEIERHGSIDALLAAERQKWEQEVKAVIQPRQQLPSTTAADGTVGSRSGPEWAGPTAISDILR